MKKNVKELSEENIDCITNTKNIAEHELIQYKSLYSDLINKRSKLIDSYNIKLKKIQKKIKYTDKSIKREEHRITEFKRVLGLPYNVIKKEHVHTKDNLDTINMYNINPITGEVIELSNYELDQLLDNSK